MIVHVYGSPTRIGIHKADHLGFHFWLDRRCRLREKIAFLIIRNARLANFLGWGEVALELSEKDYEALKLLSKVDFRRVKSINVSGDLDGLIEELELYVVASTL